MNLVNKETLEYPVTLQQFKERFPNISFPVNPNNIDFNKYGYFLVQETPQPSVTKFQKVVELTPSFNSNTKMFFQKWGIRDKKENELKETRKVVRKQEREQLLKNEKDDLLTKTYSDWSEIKKQIDGITDLESSKLVLEKIARTLFLLVNVK
ncbi:MAG: hypothetical protein PHD05_01565 [Sphaerochaetaceae bacterium]|nr:hypothetical protein [Sphaerochaetaceae bacterium]